MPMHPTGKTPRPQTRSRRWLAVGLLLCAAGCRSELEFPQNAAFVRLQEETTRIELTQPQRDNVAAIVEQWFGTPDEPRIPDSPPADLTDLLDLQRLQMAAGPVGSRQDGTPFGVFRKHCAVCHGIAGDGAGPAAAFLNPYPRDFRRGVFKHKSTSGLTTPPTDEDLRSLLVRGMPGTSMPAFQLLSDAELDALVEYVKYLAMRGAVERALIVEAVDVLEGPEDQLLDFSLRERDPDGYTAVLQDLAQLVSYVAGPWRDAPQHVTPVPPRSTDRDWAQSVARGRELYLGDVANCVKCHGPEGRGDGQTTDYDDWSKEFFDPQHPEQAKPYLALGVLPPRPILPRDFTYGIFRGGSRPEDLYLRIHNGIPGTPMPAAPMKSEDAAADDIRLAPSDLWHLVDYVLSLSGRVRDQPPAAARFAQGGS